MTTRRQALLLAGAGIAAALAGVGAHRWRGQAPAEPTTPPVWWQQRFERPEGGDFALSDFKGRVLVLNFWATWCPPCVKELPALDRLQADLGPRGVQVVGLAVDGPTPVRQFLARQPVRFPIGLAGFGGTELSQQLGNRSGALPFTAVFDRGGRLRQGKLGETQFDELLSWVNGLLSV